MSFKATDGVPQHVAHLQRHRTSVMAQLYGEIGCQVMLSMIAKVESMLWQVTGLELPHHGLN